MDFVKKVLVFFNLMDFGGTSLSLTNIALIVSIAKIASAHVAPMDGGALLLAIVNYAHKRYTNANVTQFVQNVTMPGSTGTHQEDP